MFIKIYLFIIDIIIIKRDTRDGMDLFNNKKKLCQKERQLNYYYSKKGQETYREYYLKNKDKISEYAKEYRKEKTKNKENIKDKKEDKNTHFEIKRGCFIITFD